MRGAGDDPARAGSRDRASASRPSTGRSAPLPRQLRVHHATVRRVLAQAGVPAGAAPVRASMVEPYLAFITETLAKYPTLRASRLYTMVRERGYPGAPDHFRAHRGAAAAAPGGRSVSAPAHIARRTGAGRLGALRQARHRPRGAPADGLRDGALLLAPSLPALLSRGRACRTSSAAMSRRSASSRVRAEERCSTTICAVAVLERRDEAIRFHPTLLELGRPLPLPAAAGGRGARQREGTDRARDSLCPRRLLRRAQLSAISTI